VSLSHSAVSSFVAFLKLGRPLFLGGGFILFALGAAIAAAHGHAIDGVRYAWGQGAVTAFQLMTHYANDYFDYEADVANATPTKWSGGSRVLPEGLLPRRVALIAAVVLAAIGIVLTIGLEARGVGRWTAPTLALVLVLAWEYSAPPLRLCARGLGELDTAIVVTVLVPWLGFYVHAPNLGGGGNLALTIVPLALLQFAMLIAIEFPDEAGDIAAGKRTLVVRLGAPRAAKLYAAITAAAFVWPLIALGLGLPARVALAMLVPAPIAAWRIVRLRDHADRDAFERLAFFAVFLVVVTSAAALVGWLSVAMNSSTAASS
jgi:1,4-dihydroxy-2-naphthoate polyprenyltransferase